MQELLSALTVVSNEYFYTTRTPLPGQSIMYIIVHTTS